MLELQGPEVSATKMVYPSTLTVDEKSADQKAVAEALRLAMDQFGAPRRATPSAKEVEFFELVVGGGPRPHWWRDSTSSSMDLAVLVHFDRYGFGVMRLSLVEEANRIGVAAVGFGLLVGSPLAAERVSNAMRALLDSMGVPPDHPVRRTPLLPVRVGLP
jgi:hypothetical protein